MDCSMPGFPVHHLLLAAVAAAKSLQLCLTLCDPIDGSPLGSPISGILQARTLEWVAIAFSYLLLELAETHVHRVSDAIQPSHPLSSPSLLPSVFPSTRVFPNESVLCIMWSKYQSFIFSISPSNEYSGLITFRIDWFDFLGVQGTLKSLLQNHSTKASSLWCSTNIMVQLYSHTCLLKKP